MNRDQKIISVFALGILWGISEIVIGDLVQSFPLPIRGMFLTAISIFFIITTKKLAEFKGSILLLGLIVIILKAFYYQTILHTALLAVLLLAFLAELIYIIIKDLKKASVSAGIFLMIYTFIHGIITHHYYFGRNIFTVYENLVNGSWGFTFSMGTILLLFFVLNLLIGAIVGIFFYKLTERIKNQAIIFFE